MSETATARYGIGRAPGGLVLVQELLNTIGVGRPPLPDLLAEVPIAQEWLDAAVALWAESTGGVRPEIRLGERDLPGLRTLRERLRGYLGHRPEPGPELAGSVRLTLTADGRIEARPEGRGSRWIASAVLGELHDAQRDDTLRRLKVCRNEVCSTAFYDRSRNNSGVWHDVRVCGNLVNLRASRARRRPVPGTSED